jgi:hypothetical protein
LRRLRSPVSPPAIPEGKLLPWRGSSRSWAHIDTFGKYGHIGSKT